MTTDEQMAVLTRRLRMSGLSAREASRLTGGAVSEGTVYSCLKGGPGYRCHDYTRRELERALDGAGR